MPVAVYLYSDLILSLQFLIKFLDIHVSLCWYKDFNLLTSLIYFCFQDNHLSCEADDDTYLCYNTATNKFYKIPRDNIDQLLIDSVIETGNDIISDEAPTVEESDSVDNFNDESLGLIPTKSRQSRLGLPIFKRFDGPVFWPRVNKRFSGRRKYYSFYWPFTISRKRPFDSISYRGSFTGFGKK